jgi:hypothetical protein
MAEISTSSRLLAGLVYLDAPLGSPDDPDEPSLTGCLPATHTCSFWYVPRLGLNLLIHGSDTPEKAVPVAHLRE